MVEIPPGLRRGFEARSRWGSKGRTMRPRTWGLVKDGKVIATVKATQRSEAERKLLQKIARKRS